jgi:hypothetical protein
MTRDSRRSEALRSVRRRDLAQLLRAHGEAAGRLRAIEAELEGARGRIAELVAVPAAAARSGPIGAAILEAHSLDAGRREGRLERARADEARLVIAREQADREVAAIAAGISEAARALEVLEGRAAPGRS